MSKLTVKQPDAEDFGIMIAEELEPVEMPVKEYLDIETGTYTREIFMPGGTVVVGKQHACSCVNIITKGKLIVKMDGEEGKGETIEVSEKSSHIFTSKDLGRKLLYIIEDTIFINVFSNVKAQCLADVEAELVVPSEKYNDYIKQKELAWHGQWSQEQQ